MFFAPLAAAMANGITSMAIDQHVYMQATRMPRWFPLWMVVGQLPALFSRGAEWSVLLTPAYAAIAGARERRDRTAEWFRMFPVGRVRQVITKLALVFLLSVGPVLLTAVLSRAMSLMWSWVDFGRELKSVPSEIASTYGPTLLCSGGIAWACGWSMRSETLATVFGAAGTIDVGWVAVLIEQMARDLGWMTPIQHAIVWEFTACGIAWKTGPVLSVVGMTALAAGTAIALKRRTP